VGDAPYYSRFGFSGEKTGGLWLPGPYERHRLLAREFVPGALDGAQGLIAAGKAPKTKSALAGLVARVGRRRSVPQVA
jgi:predicted N-acetyltransferase YhbS